MNQEFKIRKAIKGDDNAFLELINECKECLYRTAFAYVKDEHNALDIVQETVYKAYMSINKLKEPKYFNTWITRILINNAINFIKKEEKLICLEQKDLVNIIGINKVNNEEQIDLLDMVDKLQDKYKEIIILKYFSDLTIKEISKILDMPIGTVKTYLNKGLVNLREFMVKEII
ncbi:sigma-70 family RNA polymerase sigma factor [Clostridium tarantellae]|uniref:Sigma-70 family RNA polymerase sigma factor n=1 Tax=Clostridium tarantellae TaxID=39493 RepID=A0A6I1MGM1_9CLOT|nr:sigma-70 family RNA polymerase sigma factor [Clostridium tarantellae]MPQ42676.1 sigma-70 family RNA polymerase sigma factor [Clostridium tarantellae]